MPRGREKVLLPSGPGGIREDLNPAGLPEGALLGSTNWLTRKGVGTVRPGYELLDTLGSADRVMGFGARGHTAYTPAFVAHTITKAWAYDGTTFADKTGTWNTSTELQQVRMIMYVSGGTTYLLRTNLANNLDKWNGLAGNFVDATGAPEFRDICTVGGRVLGVYADSFPHRVQWNEFNDIDNWPIANVSDLDTTPGVFIGCQPLGPLNAALYKEDSVWVAVSQVARQPFQFQMVRHVPGPMSPAGILAYRGDHYWLADDSVVYQFNGAQVSAFATGVPRTFRNTLDWDQRLQTHAFVLMEEEPIAFWVYPGIGGEIRRAISCNLTTGAMNYHEFADEISASEPYIVGAALSWDDLTGTWDDLALAWDDWDALGTASRATTLLGSTVGQVFVMKDLPDDNGVAIPWEHVFGWKALGGLGNRFHLDGVASYWKRMSSTLPVTVGVSRTDALGDSDTEDTATIDLLDNDNHYVAFPDRRGTFAKVRFAGTATLAGLEYRGASLMGWVRGFR